MGSDSIEPDPGLSMELVVRAAQLAGAHEFIVELPEGYDTMVGEHDISMESDPIHAFMPHSCRPIHADPFMPTHSCHDPIHAIHAIHADR